MSHYEVRPGEECGIVGVINNSDAANFAYLGLYNLQHRGQESAGIITSNKTELRKHIGMGLVNDVFSEKILHDLKGKNAIGHVRYSTSGEKTIKNAQPILSEYFRGGIGVAHNGNLVQAEKIRSELEHKGSIFQTSVDSEVIIHLIARSRKPFRAAVIDTLNQLSGAYSLLIINENEVIAARDRHGFRPLFLGRMEETYIVASETCAFDIMGAQIIREIKPGEIIFFSKHGPESVFIDGIRDTKGAFCIFEIIYFSRPDSRIGGTDFHSLRKDLGRQLAKEQPAEGDVVIPVPDSSISAALGYAEYSNIPFDKGLLRSHYIGRTFIEPTQRIRNFGAKLKYNPIRSVVNNKRCIVVDDSIVRGTTCKKIVYMLRQAGAKEIHFRISAPPWQYPCCYGVDTSSTNELIASARSIDSIKSMIEVDSLGYLSIDGLYKVTNKLNRDFCSACFDGHFPVKDEDFNKTSVVS